MMQPMCIEYADAVSAGVDLDRSRIPPAPAESWMVEVEPPRHDATADGRLDDYFASLTSLDAGPHARAAGGRCLSSLCPLPFLLLSGAFMWPSPLRAAPLPTRSGVALIVLLALAAPAARAMASDDAPDQTEEKPVPIKPRRVLAPLPKGAVFGIVSGGQDFEQILFSNDGRHVSLQDRHGLTVWNLRLGKKVAEKEQGDDEGDVFTTLAFSPDGRTLQLAQKKGLLSWDWRRDKVIRSTPLLPANPWSPSDTNLDDSVVVGETRRGTGTYRFRDPMIREVVGSPLHDDPIKTMGNVIVTRDGSRGVIFFFEMRDPMTTGRFRVHEMSSGRLLHAFSEEKGRRWTAQPPSTDGRLLAVETTTEQEGPFWPHRVRVWDIAARELVLSERVQSAASRLSPDGRLLAVLQGIEEDGGKPKEVAKVLIWDLATGKLAHAFPRMKHWSTNQSLLRFSPRGDHLALSDALGLIIWDIAVVRRNLPALPPVAAGDAPKLWTALASDDAKAARLAVWRLAASPDAALKLLAKHLRPATPPVGLPSLFRRLEDDDASTREAAERGLAALRQDIDSALRAALADPYTSAEARRRLKRVLAVPLGPLKMDADRLRSWRAVEVLERVGGDEAMRLLRKIAGGHADAGETLEALTALRRLDHKRRWQPRP